MASVSNRTTPRRDNGNDPTDRNGDGRRRTSGSSAVSAVDALRAAAEQLTRLTGRSPDTVSAVERTDAGWRLEIELVELERVPSTTNILATYEVELDTGGDLVRYRRVRRYFRNAAEEG